MLGTYEQQRHQSLELTTCCSKFKLSKFCPKQGKSPPSDLTLLRFTESTKAGTLFNEITIL